MVIVAAVILSTGINHSVVEGSMGIALPLASTTLAI
jgi:hypothetical protein